MKKIKKKDGSYITQKVTQLICEVRERLLTAGRHEMSYSGEDAKNGNFVEGGMIKRKIQSTDVRLINLGANT